MSETVSTPVRRDVDGMALIGRTKHDLMGIRYDDGEDGNTPEGETPPANNEPSAGETPKPEAPKPAPPAESVEKVEDLPAWAQKIITDTRKEAGDYRAAKNAETERVNAILKAAGIETEEPDPATLLTQSQTEAAAAKRELAVFKAAAAAGADPVKLLDRNSFTSTIKDIDPSDGDALKAAITAAVEADNTLKAVRAAGASGVEQTGGTGELGQTTEAQLAQMTPEQIVEAQEKGLLKGLL